MTTAVDPDARKKTAPHKGEGGGGDGRTTITLSPSVATAIRRMSDEMGGGVNAAEVVRRALTILDVMLELDDEEQLVVRNKRTGTIERLRFAWQL